MRGFRGGNEPKLREQKMVPRFRGIGSWYQIRVSERERERERERNAHFSPHTSRSRTHPTRPPDSHRNGEGVWDRRVWGWFSRLKQSPKTVILSTEFEYEIGEGETRTLAHLPWSREALSREREMGKRDPFSFFYFFFTLFWAKWIGVKKESRLFFKIPPLSCFF